MSEQPINGDPIVELHKNIEAAVASGKWMVAVMHYADGKLHLKRMAVDLPDIPAAQRLLVENLNELSASVAK